MIDIKLKDGQSGYNVVGEYIRRYWEHNIYDTVIVSIHIDDMTEAEKNEFEESLNKAKRSDFWYMVLHYYLPTAFAVLTLIYIIIKFTQ